MIFCSDKFGIIILFDLLPRFSTFMPYVVHGHGYTTIPVTVRLPSPKLNLNFWEHLFCTKMAFKV